MSLHDEALALLTGWRPPNPAQDALRATYVAHLHAHPDGLDRGCSPGHLTASTLVVSADHRHVLLTLHAKAQAWFQLGGHCESEDPTLVAAAAREAREESGLPSLALDPVPVQLNAHEVAFCHRDGPVDHLDVRFVAVAPPDAEHRVSSESLDVAWWPVDALPTDEPGILDLVALALARLEPQSVGRSSSPAAAETPSR